MNINLDEVNSILYVKPEMALSAEDFIQISSVLDAYMKQHANLKGLVIETMYFPGWKNFNAFIAHVKFIKTHHAKIQKIAIVTNSKFADLGRRCISLLITPQIKHFPYDQVSLATQWIMQ